MIRHPLLMATGIGDLINAIHFLQMTRQVNGFMRLEGVEFEEFRNARLRAVIRNAYENVALYRAKWEAAGLSPEDIQTVNDLEKLPLTSKEDFRLADPAEIHSTAIQPHRCFTITTSGSTGSPMQFRIDEKKALLDTALSIPKHLVGLPPVGVGRAVRDFLWRRDIAFMAIVMKEEYLYHQMFWTMKHTVVEALEPVDTHIKEINRKRPEVLYTYPSVLRTVCIRARESKVVMHQPALIMVVGEVVDAPLRESARQVFDTDLLDVYGSTEAGHIAAQCSEHAGLHILSAKVILELIDDQGGKVEDGERGRVVVTDLFSRATPLIRYTGLGDYAVCSARPCACGRSYPLLDRIEGRIADTVVLPDGRKILPYQLTLILQGVPFLGKFQIRQEQPDLLRILLVKDRVPEAEAVSFAPESPIGQDILRRFEQALEARVRIELVTVEEIQPPPGLRKFPIVVSCL